MATEVTTPSAYADEAKVLALIERTKKQTQSQRWILERDWFRNVLFYIGNQWIIFDRSDKRWRERRLRPSVPKPVTNVYAATVDAITPVVAGQKPLVSIAPATDDADDIATADVAERLLPVLEEEVDMEQLRIILAKWVVLCGNGFLVNRWDKSGGSGSVYIHYERCLQCQGEFLPAEIVEANQTCPACGAINQFSPTDRAQAYPKGRLLTEVHSPFEAFIDFTRPLAKADYYASLQTYSLDQIKNFWSERGAKITADTKTGLNTGQQYLQAIAFSTELSGFGTGRGVESTETAGVFSLWHLPNRDFPEGLYAVEAGGILLETPQPLYSFDEDDRGERQFFLPVSHFQYQPVPGRVWAKTPCDDLAPKQVQRNELESLIQLIIMRGIYNAILIGPGTSISTLSGEPGQFIKYTGTKPEVVTGPSVAAAIFNWLKQIDSEFEQLAGTFDVIKGKAPAGVSAGVALQLLSERAMSRFGPVFDLFDESYRQWAKGALKLFRQHGDDERIRAIKGKKGSWAIEKFTKASLQGHVNIKTESTKARPQSQLMEQVAVQQLAELGVINPQEPGTRLQVAQLFGMGRMVEEMDVEQQHAAEEWEHILQGEKVPVSELLDNHAVHVLQHRRDARTKEFSQAPEEISAMGLEHIGLHVQILQAKQQQAVQMQMATRGGAGGGAGT